jgi:glutamate-ammonia-ligase adenylyltransferase
MALPEQVARRIQLLTEASPDPVGVRAALANLAERRPAAYQRIVHSHAALQYLIAVFAHSSFLTQEVLDAPEWIEELTQPGALYRTRSTDEIAAQLVRELSPGLPDPLALARFRRRQLLRILIRDVMGFAELPETTGELSSVADAVIEITYERIHNAMVQRFGEPGGAKFAVIALGKLGGEELNYSSDIDLMFLYTAPGETAGPVRITNKEFFQRAANQLTQLLSTYTAEGFCYRVDLRLRPDGKLGEVCISLDGARHYYETRGRDWELQMLIKARVAAGDRVTGRALLDFVEPLIYKTTLDFSAVEALSETRERLNERLAAKKRATGGGIDVKLERGGIRDIEFLVQCLQRLYGGAEPWVRHGGTLLALSRLHDKGCISDAEYGDLASAYQFLRHLEHRLQFADDRQVHTLPADPAVLDLIARRMPGGESDLLGKVREHFRQVMTIYERVVGPGFSGGEPAFQPAIRRLKGGSSLERPPHSRFEHFRERADQASMARLETDAGLASDVNDLFEHSPHFAEELIRTPDLIEEIGRPPSPQGPPRDPAELRRWYRRQMLRIQSASICRSEPIFDTLTATSALADATIARIYQIAIEAVCEQHPPGQFGYAPTNQMWTIALGRLGMREFDLASDADLVFVVPDSDGHALRFWGRVANRLVDLLSAYTGEGTLFAVDTRLRPNGSSGPLVQTESTFKDYFRDKAEAWEGITYMKSRAIAGDTSRAEAFLHELQEIDWRRYGQAGRSRMDLRQMRLRLEKEQGASHPLKAGRGGYYDIDFLLMYLRLKDAGVFYTVLNTPERIGVLSSMGHLDRDDSEFLEQAATFYRAIDHGIRILTGHAEGRLPTQVSQLALLEALVGRWSPIPLSDLLEVQAKTRSTFDRFFR